MHFKFFAEKFTKSKVHTPPVNDYTFLHIVWLYIRLFTKIRIGLSNTLIPKLLIRVIPGNRKLCFKTQLRLKEHSISYQDSKQPCSAI